MERRWRRDFIPVLAVAMLGSIAAACSDRDPASPEEDPDLEFSYDGARTGSYESEGLPTIGSNGLPEFESWAIARPDSLGGLVIAGFQSTSDDRGDVFILQLHPLGAGTFEPCDLFAGAGCHGRLLVGVAVDDLASVEEHFEITSGAVIITEAGEDRVRGTFSVVLTSQTDDTRTITIEDGVIDAPFSSDPFLGGGVSCLIRNLQDGTNEPC